MILEVLQKVCRSLNEHNIQYMISGSIALNIYALPRMTMDIDIVIELPENMIEEFIALFPESYLDEIIIMQQVKSRGMFNIIDVKSGFKIDFIMRKDSEYDKLAFNRKHKIREFNTDIWVIDLNDLVIAKLRRIQEYQSEKQILDIKNLLLNPERDMKYLKKWCIKLDLHTYGLI